MPLITVITVVYNDYVGLKKTISSVACQSEYMDVEYIVVDGKSTDQTISLLERHPKVTKYISEKDKGIYDAMNKGIALSTGEWIIFLNAGDVFSDETILRKFKNTISDIGSDVNFIFGDYLSGGEEYKQELSIRFLSSHMINHQSIFYRRDLFAKEVYAIGYRYCADYKHLVDNYANIVACKINSIVSIFDDSGVSSQIDNKYKMWAERLRAVWCSSLPFSIKVRLSRRGILALPYQFVRAKLRKIGIYEK